MSFVLQTVAGILRGSTGGGTPGRPGKKKVNFDNKCCKKGTDCCHRLYLEEIQRKEGFRICQQLLQSVEIAESIGRPQQETQLTAETSLKGDVCDAG